MKWNKNLFSIEASGFLLSKSMTIKMLNLTASVVVYLTNKSETEEIKQANKLYKNSGT